MNITAMRHGHAPRPYATAMRHGHAPRPCATAVRHGCAPWLCATAMSHGYAPRAARPALAARMLFRKCSRKSFGSLSRSLPSQSRYNYAGECPQTIRINIYIHTSIFIHMYI